MAWLFLEIVKKKPQRLNWGYKGGLRKTKCLKEIGGNFRQRNPQQRNYNINRYKMIPQKKPSEEGLEKLDI